MEVELIITRSLLHRYADLIDDEDLLEVKMVMQQYAARAMNKKYMEEHKNEKAQ
jgi:hypothetical protein